MQNTPDNLPANAQAATNATSPSIDSLVSALLASYRSDSRMSHLDASFLPSRSRTIVIIELLRKLIFPGYFDDHRVCSETVTYHTGELLAKARDAIHHEVRQALRYEHNRELANGDTTATADDADAAALNVTHAFLARLPELRRLLMTDIQAGFDGDPAAASTDEIVFCYPGLDAIFIHRVAHELYRMNVPLLPRIMSEVAHNETGIDIHPGAIIDESFFIDHGTGVVIGETTTIGKRVKVYQGVTLGALSTKGGQDWRGRKRHPTIEDDVTIYGGAIILGGDTVVGQGSTIGGSVFLTASVPPGYTVSVKPPELKMSARRQKGQPAPQDFSQDFQI